MNIVASKGICQGFEGRRGYAITKLVKVGTNKNWFDRIELDQVVGQIKFMRTHKMNHTIESKKIV